MTVAMIRIAMIGSRKRMYSVRMVLILSFRGRKGASRSPSHRMVNRCAERVGRQKVSPVITGRGNRATFVRRSKSADRLTRLAFHLTACSHVTGKQAVGNDQDCLYHT